MKDFDFDELDRAVSSVLTEAPKREEATLETQDTPVPARTATPDRPRSVAPRQARSGRTMDIVRTGSAPKVTPIATITPVPDEVLAPPPRKEVPMGDITLVKRSEVTPPSIPTEEVAVPIEDSVWDMPESPFLPDAKVEKRPLGQSEPTGEALVEVELEDNGKLENIAEPILEDVSVVSTDLEAELVPEFDVLNTDSIAEEPRSEDTPLQDPPVATSEIVAVPTGPVEITPQYATKPVETSASGELFDTEAYHMPFAAPVKKTKGRTITLIVFVLILLIAALGAGFYFYVLPLL